jgi:hypothetical protein
MLWLEINWNETSSINPALMMTYTPICATYTRRRTASRGCTVTVLPGSSDVSSAVVWVETPGTEDEYAVAGDQLERAAASHTSTK